MGARSERSRGPSVRSASAPERGLAVTLERSRFARFPTCSPILVGERGPIERNWHPPDPLTKCLQYKTTAKARLIVYRVPRRLAYQWRWQESSATLASFVTFSLPMLEGCALSGLQWASWRPLLPSFVLLGRTRVLFSFSKGFVTEFPTSVRPLGAFFSGSWRVHFEVTLQFLSGGSAGTDPGR